MSQWGCSRTSRTFWCYMFGRITVHGFPPWRTWAVLREPVLSAFWMTFTCPVAALTERSHRWYVGRLLPQDDSHTVTVYVHGSQCFCAPCESVPGCRITFLLETGAHLFWSGLNTTPVRVKTGSCCFNSCPEKKHFNRTQDVHNMEPSLISLIIPEQTQTGFTVGAMTNQIKH